MELALPADFPEVVAEAVAEAEEVVAEAEERDRNLASKGLALQPRIFNQSTTY